MAEDSKPSRKPWVVVGIVVAVVALLMLSPPSFRESLTQGLKDLILKIHDAPRR